MKNTKNFLNRMMCTLAVVSFISFVPFTSLQAQNNRMEESKVERIKTMKKVRLLEVLDLDATNSDKFLSKYNDYDNKISKKMIEIRSNLNDLRDIIKTGNKTNPAIKEKTALISKQTTEMQTLMADRDKDIKTMLDDYTYAKYLVFELGFKDKLLHKMMKGDKGDKGDRSKGNEKRERRRGEKKWDK